MLLARLQPDLAPQRARRAGAVLYEFKAGGLGPQRYNITAVGKADTDNLCAESTEECWVRNRRITLRLQIDTLKLDRKNKGL